jgi:signal transduction histidine kinase/ActR/RegA family two-component response regulator
LNVTIIEELREKLVNKLLFLLAILVFPLLVLSLSRYFVQGWLPVMGTHILLFGVIELIWFNRQYLTGAFKLGAIVVALSALGTANLLLTEAPGFFCTLTLVSSVVVGVWHGMHATLIYWAVMCLLGLILAAFHLHLPLQFFVEYLSLFTLSCVVVMLLSEYSEALTLALDRASASARLAKESEASEHEAHRRLEQKNAHQAEMFAIISHELRTPASAVAMMLAEADKSSFDEVKSQMKDSVDHLLNVLDDMRQAVNPQINLQLKTESFTPPKLLAQVVSQVSHLLKEHGLQLHLNMDQCADQTLLGDTRRIKIALLNLIRNAALHSGGEHVWLRYRSELKPEEPGQVRTFWVVEDDGEGIEETLIPNMFKAFQRGPSHAEGSGLGLYILRQSIDRLGGKLQYRANAHGGARFEIRLSMSIAKPVAQPTPIPNIPQDLKQLRVLVAEDHKMLRKAMQMLLSQMVGQLSMAVNGTDALRQQQLSEYDLIITDLFMPEMDGIQLVKALREASVTTPVIGITAATIGNELQAFLDAGADAVLGKPISLKSFNDAIAQLRRDGRLHK